MRLNPIGDRSRIGRRLARTASARRERREQIQPQREPRMWSLLLPAGYSRRPY